MKMFSEDWRVLTKAYRQHKAGAATRNLPFTLSFAQWAALWAPYWDRREALGLRMCRYLDVGGYVPGGVYIGTAADNYFDQRVVSAWNAYWHRWSAQHSDGNTRKTTKLSNTISSLRRKQRELSGRFMANREPLLD